ncbi:MAG: hypothetical protein FD119_3516 [Stygiobacter sp.]|nr:MAG: hypothetical protein FD119_3516 [Stygiobacter sp.]
MLKSVLRFASYSSVAALSAGSDWLTFAILMDVLGLGNYASLAIARVVGGLTSFLVNRNVTWHGTRSLAVTRQGRRFLVLYVFSFGLSLGLFILLGDILRLNPYAAKLVTDLSCFVVNFLVMNSYVYNERSGPIGWLRSLLSSERAGLGN